MDSKQELREIRKLSETLYKYVPEMTEEKHTMWMKHIHESLEKLKKAEMLLVPQEHSE